MKQLTVAELIAVLQTLPPDLPVEVEGDSGCYSYCGGAKIETHWAGKEKGEQSYVLVTIL